MPIRNWGHVIFVLLIFMFLAKGQAQVSDTTNSDSLHPTFFVGYPIAFYFPETRLGFGGAGILSHYPGKKKSTRPSVWQFGGAYTLNKQLLLFGTYQYFLRENQTEIFGEIGYYDYFYFYYGIGNSTRQADEESYLVRFPRFRVHALERIFPKFRAGILYKFDEYGIYDVRVDGLLDKEQPVGYDGGTTSMFGLISRYDTRDNVNLPLHGTFLTLSWERNTPFLGSDFSFDRLLLDAAFYLPMGDEKVLALHSYTGTINGSPPFQEFLFMGGGRRARGTVEGRFRDRNILLFQGAYRFPLFWRFRLNTFASLGRVANEYEQLFRGVYHLNYGLGLRFVLSPEEGILLRADLGFGSEAPAFYLTVGEAF